MNINKSLIQPNQSLLRSIAGTNKKINNNLEEPNYEEYEKILESNIHKSYLFQAVPKSDHSKQKENKTLAVSNRRRIFKSSIGESKRIRETSINRTNGIKEVSFSMLMTSLTEESCSCRQLSGIKEEVRVTLSEFKDLTIKKKNKVEYYVNFNTVEAKLMETEVNKHSFVLKICGQELFKFEPVHQDNEKEFLKLKKILENSLSDSLGRQFHMMDLKDNSLFLETRYKPVTEFAEHCQTGDILLYKGIHFMGKLQRFFTDSNYDHVAMIYKDPVHGILILECNSTSGVCLSPWEYVLKYKWYNFVECLAWRKLEGIERNEEFLEDMRTVVSEKIGESYHISFDRLFPSTTSQIYEPKQPETQGKEESNVGENRRMGYFCSELIAVIYKDMNILTREKNDPNFKPSNNFFPFHFSSKFNANLKKGKLSEEYAIHFNNEEIEDYYNFDE